MRFDFDYENFLSEYPPDLVKAIKDTIKSLIIDKLTVVPYIFFRPLEIVEKYLVEVTENIDPEINQTSSKDLVIIFMDLMSSFTEFIRYLITIKNHKIQNKHYLIMNFPGQPLTVYDPTQRANTLKMASMVDSILGRLNENEIINITDDKLYFIGNGSGCSILTDLLL